MLLLSNKFQTIRISQGSNIIQTIDGPDIISVQLLNPKINKVLDLQPNTNWITSPDDDLLPDIEIVKDLKPTINRGKNLKPKPK